MFRRVGGKRLGASHQHRGHTVAVVKGLRGAIGDHSRGFHFRRAVGNHPMRPLLVRPRLDTSGLHRRHGVGDRRARDAKRHCRRHETGANRVLVAHRRQCRFAADKTGQREHGSRRPADKRRETQLGAKTRVGHRDLLDDQRRRYGLALKQRLE